MNLSFAAAPRRGLRNLVSLLALLTMIAALLPVLAQSAGAAHPVSINEIRITQPGSDNDEYFELAGPAGTPLDGLSYIVIGDGPFSTDGWVEEAVDLSGSSIAADGFFLVTESSFDLGIQDLTTSLNFENSDNVTHLLVENFTGSVGDDLDLDDDGILDLTPWDAVVDLIALIEEDNPPSGTEFHYGPPTVGPDFIFVPAHVYQCADWEIGDFDPGNGVDTPGYANACDPAVSVTIMDIQGEAHVSPLLGKLVTTSGVVTAVAFNGFYMQDPAGDGNDATSDGIFVPDFGTFVDPGDEVTVTGVVQEVIPGGAATGNLSTTQLTGVDIDRTGTGASLPSTIIGLSGRVPPNVVTISDDELPTNLQTDPGVFDPANDGIDFYESLEAMLVTVEDAQAVSANRRFGTFSAEFFTVPNQGAKAIIEPNDAMTQRGGIAIQAGIDGYGDLNPERVQIQLSGTPLYPGDMNLQVKVGDLVGDITGVVGYSFGNYEVNAVQEIEVTDGGLTPETTDINPNANRLTVASYNVLNLSVTGSGDQAQSDKLGEQIVDALGSPDVIALQEIQDDSAETDDGTVTADATLQMLIDSIVAAGGPTYSAFDVDPANNTQGGVPGGNIRNAFLYNSDRVDLVDFFALDATLLATAGANPAAFDGTRIPLVGVFEFKGGEFTVISVHNTSRFGSTPIFGGPQPFVQAGEAEREEQSKALNQYVDFLLADDPDAAIMVAGDFNTFEFTDELLEDVPGEEGVLTNLVPFKDSNPNNGLHLGEEDFYSFIFDGNSQMLDHFFVTDSLLPSAKFDVVHVNVDFPRTFINTTASDHEPLLASFRAP